MIKRSPFRYFKTSPEIIRLAVMLYVRFPLSLRNVEDLFATSTTRPNAYASLQTCVVLHAVRRLFACWGHSGSLKALHRPGVGLGWLYSPKWTPLLLTPQFRGEPRRCS